MLRIMDNYNEMYKYLLTIKHASEIQSQIYDIQDVIANLEENIKGGSVRNAQKKKKKRKNCSLIWNRKTLQRGC